MRRRPTLRSRHIRERANPPAPVPGTGNGTCGDAHLLGSCSSRSAIAMKAGSPFLGWTRRQLAPLAAQHKDTVPCKWMSARLFAPSNPAADQGEPPGQLTTWFADLLRPYPKACRSLLDVRWDSLPGQSGPCVDVRLVASEYGAWHVLARTAGSDGRGGVSPLRRVLFHAARTCTPPSWALRVTQPPVLSTGAVRGLWSWRNVSSATRGEKGTRQGQAGMGGASAATQGGRRCLPGAPAEKRLNRAACPRVASHPAQPPSLRVVAQSLTGQ